MCLIKKGVGIKLLLGMAVVPIHMYNRNWSGGMPPSLFDTVGYFFHLSS